MNVNEVKLVDSVVQVFYTFVGFLSACFISHLEKDIEISNYN